MKNFFEIIISEKVIVPIITIIIAVILYKIMEKIIKNIKIKGNDFGVKRFQTIFILILNIIKNIIIAIVIVVILSVYGVHTTTLITSLGALGVVGGIAFQDIIKDLYTGINIIIDDYFFVGDRIKYEDFEGEVTDFGLKSTKIKSDTGEVLIVANRNLHEVINLSMKKTIFHIEIPTSIESNKLKVEKIINEIISEIVKYDYVEEKETVYLGIEKINSDTIIYLFKVKCKQGKDQELKREINQKIIEYYKKNNIVLKD